MGLYNGPNTDFPDWNALKYRCCCGCCHIEKTVFWLSVIWLMFAIVGLIGAHYDHRSLTGEIITILMLSTVLYALFAREPRFFLLFLIMKGIALVSLAVLYIAIVASMIGQMQEIVQRRERLSTVALHPTAANSSMDNENNNETTTTTTSLPTVAHQKRSDQSKATIFLAAIFLYVAIFALAGAFLMWIYSLYWRAWKYLKAEVEWATTIGKKQQKKNLSTAVVVVHPVTELNMKRLDVWGMKNIEKN